MFGSLPVRKFGSYRYSLLSNVVYPRRKHNKIGGQSNDGDYGVRMNVGLQPCKLNSEKIMVSSMIRAVGVD
jgi:hypothetical protein